LQYTQRPSVAGPANRSVRNPTGRLADGNGVEGSLGFSFEVQMPVRTRTIRRWSGWAMLGVLLASVAIWQFGNDALPQVIRISTGYDGGLYYQTGLVLADELMQRTGRPVRVIESRGSGDNYRHLTHGETELAILQLGTVPSDGIVALAPLYPDATLIVARRGSGIASVDDLDGHAVSVGPLGSGMRASAETLLEHYQIELGPENTRADYFARLADDPSLDAAIITTGLMNPDLRRLLERREFELLPILDSEAMVFRFPQLTAYTIPRGLYSERPPMPDRPIQTIATPNFLATTSDASPALVAAVLGALHDRPLQSKIPGLIGKDEAARWSLVPYHTAASAHYDPYEGIGLLANLMETIAAAKELLFALGAGIYLLWSWWRELRRREEKHLTRLQKERLDGFLRETIEVEHAQMAASDPVALRGYLDEITRIKLRAIEKLTVEHLRADNMFSIFLLQCSAVSRKIEAKLEVAASGNRFQPAAIEAIQRRSSG